MEKEKLIATLRQLHNELSQADEVDPEALQLLQALTDDMAKLQGADAPQPAEQEALPVSSGLKDLLLKFETEHPKLATRLGEVADALAGMGF